MSADPPRPPETLAPLRELAEKATPGPWLIDDTKRAFEEWRVEHEHDGLIAFCDGRRNLHASVNAAYIAAVSPVVVLALLKQIEILSAARDALRDGLARNVERAQKVEGELDAQRAALATAQGQIASLEIQKATRADAYIQASDRADRAEAALATVTQERDARKLLPLKRYKTGGYGAMVQSDTGSWVDFDDAQMALHDQRQDTLYENHLNMAEWQARLEQAEVDLATARAALGEVTDILQWLVDEQEGPPLIRRQVQYEAVMAEARRVLTADAAARSGTE